jgi:hypothetical protein
MRGTGWYSGDNLERISVVTKPAVSKVGSQEHTSQTESCGLMQSRECYQSPSEDIFWLERRQLLVEEL